MGVRALAIAPRKTRKRTIFAAYCQLAPGAFFQTVVRFLMNSV